VSRVYFHSQHGEAELRGSERAHCGLLVDNLADGFLGSLYGDDVERLLGLVRPDHYLHRQDRRSPGWVPMWRDMFATAFRSGFYGEMFTWKGKDVDSFALRLNTALKYGNDTVRLAARLHGQCEIHCYVEGINRAWLAGLIVEGLSAGIFREGQWYEDRNGDRKWSDQGWRDVVKLLLDRDDEPVVCSYSVCDQFPNAEVASWTPPPMPDGWAPDWAASEAGRAEWERDHPEVEDRRSYYEDEAGSLWYELPEAEQWRRALEGVRGGSGGLEISPTEFGKYYFAHGLDISDLLAPDYADRLDKALGFSNDEGDPA
jgi:hypothetical protein